MIYCDIINSNNLFYFGRPSNASYELDDITYYKAHKNLQTLRDAGGYNAGFNDIDYFYYEIEMIPNAINIKGGSSDPLSIKFEDSVGITLTSHKKLSLNANDDIIIKTPKSVKINNEM